jgi:ParB family transcriptional regulator, chromosome partitioning protein
MAGESRGLGRGLDALLSARPRPVVRAADATDVHALPVAAIQPGSSQPRKVIQQQPLEELAASIKANGLIQPIVVRPLAASADGAPTHEIVAGERRWQAAKLAGLTEIPVVVRELSDQDAVAVALIENIQREELTPAEEARALQRLIGEFALTHAQVADAVGRSRAAVTNLVRLLDLPPEVVALIDSRAISMGHARALLGLEKDAERVRVGLLVAERGLSVRETENLVRKMLKGEGAAPAKPPDLSVVSEVLRTKAVHVQLHQKMTGAARIVIEVADAKSRDAIVEAIKGAVEE